MYVLFSSMLFKAEPGDSCDKSQPLAPPVLLPAIYNSLCFLLRGRKILDEASVRFQDVGIFKMQLFSGWNVFVLRKEYIADMRASRDHDLSLYHAQNDVSSSRVID